MAIHSNKNLGGPLKFREGKTAKSKKHQKKIHGNKPGYGKTKTGIVKVLNTNV